MLMHWGPKNDHFQGEIAWVGPCRSSNPQRQTLPGYLESLPCNTVSISTVSLLIDAGLMATIFSSGNKDVHLVLQEEDTYATALPPTIAASVPDWILVRPPPPGEQRASQQWTTVAKHSPSGVGSAMLSV